MNEYFCFSHVKQQHARVGNFKTSGESFRVLLLVLWTKRDSWLSKRIFVRE